MDKKLTVKRVIIFCVLAFSLMALSVIVFSNILSGNKYCYDRGAEMNAFNIFAAELGMLTPATAVFITRVLTKEGMKEHMLVPGFSKNRKYYITAVIVSIFTAVYRMIAFPLVYGLNFHKPENIFRTVTGAVITISLGFVYILTYFGEEYGWRAYLFPKLEKLMSTESALIVSGLLWGLWHMPLTLLGHNFGRDLKFFPFSNIALMCLMCICISPLFSWVSKKSDSVWPAVLCHYLNNEFISQSSGILVNQNEAASLAESHTPEISSAFTLGIFPYMITGIIFFFLMSADSRKK